MRETFTLNDKLCMQRVREEKGHSQTVASSVGRPIWHETYPGKQNGSGRKILGAIKDLKFNYKRYVPQYVEGSWLGKNSAFR